jgi:hypothetical protein
MKFDFELAPVPTVAPSDAPAPTFAPTIALSDAPTLGGLLLPVIAAFFSIAVLVVGVYVSGYVAAKKFASKQLEQQLSASNPQRKRVDVEQPHA